MDRLTAFETAAGDIGSHIPAWTGILERYLDSPPPDVPQSAEHPDTSDRSYIEHELRAMRRDLAALMAV